MNVKQLSCAGSMPRGEMRSGVAIPRAVWFGGCWTKILIMLENVETARQSRFCHVYEGAMLCGNQNRLWLRGRRRDDKQAQWFAVFAMCPNAIPHNGGLL